MADKRKLGRNDPCSCGSGKKAKRCCLAQGAGPQIRTTMSASIPLPVPGLELEPWRPPLRDQPTSADLAPESPSPDYVRHSDHVRCVLDLCDEAHGIQLGVDWLSQLPGAFLEADYASYHLGVLAYEGTLPDGRRILDWALSERGAELSPEERTWLEAEQQSCTSVWQVLEVVEGETVVLLDRLRAERRTVHETVMTYGCEVGWFVCARVTQHEGRDLYCGLHPQPLQAEAERPLFERLRGRFGEGGLGPELLRREVVDLLRVWEETCEEMRAADEEDSRPR